MTSYAELIDKSSALFFEVDGKLIAIDTEKLSKQEALAKIKDLNGAKYLNNIPKE